MPYVTAPGETDLQKINTSVRSVCIELNHPQSTTYSQLPAATATNAAGMLAYITDSTTSTWGANVTTGGGTASVLIWSNAMNWTVVGK